LGRGARITAPFVVFFLLATFEGFFFVGLRSGGLRFTRR
jgi:hypothetical protein